MPERLVEELRNELESRGLVRDVRDETNRDVSVLMRIENGTATPLSASGLAQCFKSAHEVYAATMDLDDAKQFRKASQTGSGTPMEPTR